MLNWPHLISLSETNIVIDNKYTPLMLFNDQHLGGILDMPVHTYILEKITSVKLPFS